MQGIAIERLSSLTPQCGLLHGISGPQADGYAAQVGRAATLRQRSMVFVAARSLFGEQGSRSVTVRELAARSRVAPPQIYRIIGGRDAVLESALFEMLLSCIEQAPRLAAANKINVVLAFVDTLWVSTKIQPSYARHQIELNARVPGGRRIDVCFRNRVIETLRIWLSEMCGPSDFDRSADIDAIAAVLDSHIRATALDWADGNINLQTLRWKLAAGVNSILAGFVDSADLRRTMEWVKILK